MPELDARTLNNLDDDSRKEIMQWLEGETSKSKVQSCMFIQMFDLLLN